MNLVSHVIVSVNPEIFTLPENSILREVINSLDLLEDLKDAYTPFIDIHPMPSGLAMKYKVVNDNYTKCKNIVKRPPSEWSYKECIRLMVGWLHFLPKQVLNRFTYYSLLQELKLNLKHQFEIRQDFPGFKRYYQTFMNAFDLRDGEEEVSHEDLHTLKVSFDDYINLLTK